MSAVFERVLVPIEFAPVEEGELAVERAVRLGEEAWVTVCAWTVRALELAARLGAGGELVLVHAMPDVSRFASRLTPGGLKDLEQAAVHHATGALAAIARRHCPGASLRCVVEVGRALDVILAAAGEHAVDAIVLAASARTGVSRAFLGSTADKVIRQAMCPVVVIPSVVHE